MLNNIYYDICSYILDYLNLDEIKNLNITNKNCNKITNKYINFYKLKCRICNIISNRTTECLKCSDIIYEYCDCCYYYIIGDYYIKQGCLDSLCHIVKLCTFCVENRINQCNYCSRYISNAETYENDRGIFFCFHCLYYDNYHNKSKKVRDFISYTPWVGVDIGEELYRNDYVDEPFIISSKNDEIKKYYSRDISEEGYESIILCVKLGYITLEQFYNL